MSPEHEETITEQPMVGDDESGAAPATDGGAESRRDDVAGKARDDIADEARDAAPDAATDAADEPATEATPGADARVEDALREAAGVFPTVESLPDATRPDEEKCIELLRDVSLKVKVELGRGRMFLRDILRLTQGSVVELEKNSGDPLDIYVNNRLIARGEVLVLHDQFCVRVTEILTPEECFRVRPA